MSAVIDVLHKLRELEEKTARELLAIARKSRAPSIKAVAYTLLSDKVVHSEVMRALVRAYDRLEEMEIEFRRVVQERLPGLENEPRHELERALLKLEELFVVNRDIERQIESYLDEIDKPVVRKLLEAIMESEKAILGEIERLVNSIREELKRR